MKQKSELFEKTLVIGVTLIIGICLIFLSVKYIYSYTTFSDTEICQMSDSTLINGQCHSECDFSVSSKRNTLLFGGIAFPFVTILLIFYLKMLLKNKSK